MKSGKTSQKLGERQTIDAGTTAAATAASAPLLLLFDLLFSPQFCFAALRDDLIRVGGRFFTKLAALQNTPPHSNGKSATMCFPPFFVVVIIAQVNETFNQ